MFEHRSESAPGQTDVSVDDEAPDAFDPLIASFAKFWTDKTLRGQLPARADLSIEELRPWMGRILMMDVINGGEDFAYRLVGTALAEANGRDLTGKRISQCDYSGNIDHVLATFRRPIVARGPVFRRGEAVWNPEKRWRQYESVHCPLASDGENIDITVGVQVYFR